MTQTARPTGRPRRGGRPTRAEAAQLDREVRECALRLFLENGYDGTTMDAVAQAAGTTKSSLYSRFESKEALFSSVLGWAVRSGWPFDELAGPDTDDLEGALLAIARAAVRRAVDPAFAQLGRIAIAQAARFPDIARRAHSAGSWPRQQLVADLLKRHQARGEIIADDPEILAELFIAMVSGVPARLASFGIVRDPETEERHLQAAVRLFLRGVRPDGA
jgi:AcrR family transcriptional regulator